MQNYTPLINFGKNIPMKLNLLTTDGIGKNWQKNLTIYLLLNGTAEIIRDDSITKMSDDDIIVINSGSIFEINTISRCIFVELEIDIEKCVDFNNDVKFDCNSAKDNNKGKFYSIKKRIAELVKGNSDESDYLDYFNLSYLYAILSELSKHFKSDKQVLEIHTQKYLERMNRIVDYINKNYKEVLTLSKLADVEHLSVPYLSAFFEKYMGVNFLTYYNDVRLDHAVNELITSDNPVEIVASNNGFPNPRSFVNLFKKKYDTLPSLYRKDPKNRKSQSIRDLNVSVSDDENTYLHLLAKYLHTDSDESNYSNEIDSDYKNINIEKINVSETVQTLKHTFRTFTSVGRAKELLYSDVQEMLKELQNEVGYEYIKFHGLLADDMHVYEEDENGKPHYSFVLIDKVLDFLISIKLKPLIEFSFMPKDLSKDKSRAVYSSPYYISEPSDINKWTDLISALTLHLIDRYGHFTVKKWLFCVWNEPDTGPTMFGLKKDEDFYNLYKATYSTIKGIDKSFSFGSPSLLVSYNFNLQWIKRFILWTKENKCSPDFMNIHYYDNDFSDERIETHTPAHPAHSRLNRDENSFSKSLTQTKLFFEELGVGNVPIYLTEWNLTVSHRNLLNDTCFKSCYLTKNLLENYDVIDSFGYWVLSDFIEETQPSKDQFHGGLGLFTFDGIKKPHYFAISFINKLGKLLVKRGNSFFITKSDNKIQILLYNYEHFNHLYASGETFDMTFTERYTPFSKLGKMDISLELTHINSKKCLIKEYTINQSRGSAFDNWVRMGASKLNPFDIQYLKNISIPSLYIRESNIENGSLSISTFLEPLEVRFIEITLD